MKFQPYVFLSRNNVFRPAITKNCLRFHCQNRVDLEEISPLSLLHQSTKMVSDLENYE